MLPSACLDGVGTPDDIHFRAQYPAYACPCHRSTPNLAADGVWLRVGMVRYSFPVRLFHPHHSSRFTGAFQDSLPAASQALPGGAGYPLGSSAEFQSSLHLILPAQASPVALKFQSECMRSV